MCKNRVQNVSYIFISPISQILLLLLFFPSITFSIVPAEIFPWGILFMLFFIRKYDLRVLLYIVSISIHGLFLSLLNSHIEPLQFLRSVSAYINTLLLGSVILNLPNAYLKNLINILKIVFFTLIILGIIQFLGTFEFIDPILKFIVPRSSAQPLGFGGRGITLLSSEPSRASYEFLFIYVAFRMLFLEDKKRMLLLSDLIFFVFEIFLIRSATGIFYVLAYVIVFYDIKIVGSALLIIILMFYVFYSTIPVSFQNVRAIDVTFRLLNSIQSPSIFLKTLLNVSGFRLVSIISAIKYSFFSPLGGGVGNWEKTSLDAFNLLNISPHEVAFFKYIANGRWIPARPSSYVGNILLDTGIVGFIIFSIIIYKVYIYRYISISDKTKKTIILFLIYLFTIGSVGNPVPWITSSLVIAYEYRKSKLGIDIMLFENGVNDSIRIHIKGDLSK